MKQIARRKSKRRSDKNQTGKGFARERKYIPKGYSKFAKMCDHYGGYDWFNVNHLIGIFNKYVGKPWDECYSHVCEVLEPRFHDSILNNIGMPIWQPEYVMDTAIEIRTTYVYKGIKRRDHEYEYKIVGEETIPAEWCYSQGYHRSASSLSYLKQDNHYKDYYYVDGDSGLVQKIACTKYKPRVVRYPRVAFDYRTRKYMKVLSFEEIDGMTEQSRNHYDWRDRWDAKVLADREHVTLPKSQYTIVSKGTQLVEDLDENLNIILVEEPIFVLKRIKQPK